MDNVVATPHIGASTKESQERIGEEIVRLLTEKFIKD
jgi:phosphoglycerate dehydrogenase-like enzyme